MQLVNYEPYYASVYDIVWSFNKDEIKSTTDGYLDLLIPEPSFKTCRFMFHSHATELRNAGK